MTSKNLHIVLFLLVVLLSVCMHSCKPDTECRQSADIYCKVLFACDSLNEESELVTYSTIDSITVQGVGSDSVLYDNAYNKSFVLLPLRGDTTLTEYEMIINGQKEILSILHENTENFISLACGCFVYHTIDSVYVATGVSDSIDIINASVEAIVQDNIRLHFHF